MRNINRIEKLLKVRKTKYVKYDALVQILTYSKGMKKESEQAREENDQFERFLLRLKTNILEILSSLFNGEEPDDLIVVVIEGIHEFNCRIRGRPFKPSLGQKKQVKRSQGAEP